MSGLKKWLDEKWVDIGAPKKNGKQTSAVKRKRSVSNTGPKPTNVATFSKRDRKAIGGMI